jgi:DNA helicase-2/ATP-dependent DNA helicase PcrA
MAGKQRVFSSLPFVPVVPVVLFVILSVFRMDPLSSLNPEQRDAVLHTEGPLLILAGAGSGKTRVITARIGHVISGNFATPGEVLAVTFTNKAAEEMRGRVEKILGEDCRQAWISTFHSLSARLLRREAPAIGLSRDFVIYDSSDQIAVVKQAMKSLGIDDKMIQPRAALSRISQAKNRMEGPADMRSTGWSLRDQQISRVYEAYLRALTDAGALDFDDLLLKTVDLFENVERVRNFLQPEVQVRAGGRVSGHEQDRSTCSSAGWRKCTGICASSAIPISPSIDGAARIFATSWTSSTTFRTPRS